ncbi:MAG: lipoate--protein ligase, partial [Eggerthellaceae bacterium]|nr:lipoate--protein ligase [Eggerthellaceae bacterium]
MIDESPNVGAKALFLRSTSTNPFANLALERLLMDEVLPGEQLLFLWQNHRTVVVGRNQNPWKECRIAELEKDGGFLARRLSGGGAVYHDSGNLNFTFISPKASYSVERNLRVICDAVKSFGLDAAVSGRNDVEVEGMKFSGNAFFETDKASCHHGTLMIDVDVEELSRYLQPDPRKLSSRSIDSVKARVVNLQDLNSLVTVVSLGDALVEAFAREYGAPACEMSSDRLPQPSSLSRET